MTQHLIYSNISTLQPFVPSTLDLAKTPIDFCHKPTQIMVLQSREIQSHFLKTI